MTRKLFLILLLVTPAVPSLDAAIAAASQWQVWPTTGSDQNGGFFSVGVALGTSTGTDAVIDASLRTKFTSASHGTFASDVGKWIKFTSGTGFTIAFYHIDSSSGSAAIVDRAIGTLASTGGNYTLYPGIDRTLQTGAQVTIDNSTITATCNTNTLTFVSGYTPSNADIGNSLQFPTGITNITAGNYEISNTNASTTWTLAGPANACTAATNTVTLGTGSVASKMGGALATLTLPQTLAIASNKVFVKATGTLTTGALTFAVNVSPANTVPPTQILGYTSTVGDGGQVTVRPSSAGLTVFTISGVGYELANFFIDGGGANTVGTCVNITGAFNVVRNVKCGTFTGSGLVATAADNTIAYSEVTAGTACTNGISWAGASTVIIGNHVHGNACAGITNTTDNSAFVGFNLVYGNGANPCITFGSASTILNNTADGCSIGLVAAILSDMRTTIIKNNLITASTTGLEMWTSAGWGFSPKSDGNCYFGNTTNRTNSDDEGITTTANGLYPYRSQLDHILGSTPYVDNTHASNNYAITANGGTGYQVGTPGAFLGSTNTGFISCGALVPQAVTGGGGATISF